MAQINAPYLIKRNGIFHLHKRVPKQLVRHFGKQFIRKSLRTRDRKEAVRVASSLVASMEKEWNEQILSVSSNTSVFTLFEEQTCFAPLLSEAGRFYVEMKGKAGDKRFERYTSRVVSEVVGLAGDKLISAYSRQSYAKMSSVKPPKPPSKRLANNCWILVRSRRRYLKRLMLAQRRNKTVGSR